MKSIKSLGQGCYGLVKTILGPKPETSNPPHCSQKLKMPGSHCKVCCYGLNRDYSGLEFGAI